MAKVERFEDLKCWQEARLLTNGAYELVGQEALSRDFRLRDQLTGVAISTMTNIAEGFARYHKADFIRFLDYAQSSAAEVKSLLYVVLDQQYATAEKVNELQRRSETCQSMVLGLLKHVRRTMREEADTVSESQVLYDGYGGKAPSKWTRPESFIAKNQPPHQASLQKDISQ